MRKLPSSAEGKVMATVPVHDKRLGWTLKSKPVAYYAGESPADAESFASAIRQSYEDMRARERRRLYRDA